MKQLTGKKTTLMLCLLLTLTVTAVAFAMDDAAPPEVKEPGAGYHHGQSGFHGKQGMKKCLENFTKEEAEKLKAECQKFHASTQNLRMEIMSKQLAVKSELAKPEPNADAAVALQKELSDLQAQLGEQRILHLIAMKAISPRAEVWCQKNGGKRHGCAGMGCQGFGKTKGRGCPVMGEK